MMEDYILWFVLSPVIAIGFIIATLFWLVILAGVCDIFIKAVNAVKSSLSKEDK